MSEFDPKEPMAIPSTIIFDLDGTLTKPYLDFDAIRREIGLPPGPILESLEEMPAPERERAELILTRHERDGAKGVTLYEDAALVIQTCRDRGYSTAILTRNARENVETILRRHHLSIDTFRSREDGVIKPSPSGIISICEELRSQPDQSWMVGDFAFDILAGRAAGAKTVLMNGGRERPYFADQADHVIERLSELLELI
jgi:HAD superfamily hydrolase (TIGR01509 family)